MTDESDLPKHITVRPDVSGGKPIPDRPVLRLGVEEGSLS